MTKLEEILDGLLFMECGDTSVILLDYNDVKVAMKEYAEFCCEQQRDNCALFHKLNYLNYDNDVECIKDTPIFKEDEKQV